MHHLLVLGALKGIGSVEVGCTCSHSGLFITARVANAKFGTQIGQREMGLETVPQM